MGRTFKSQRRRSAHQKHHLKNVNAENARPSGHASSSALSIQKKPKCTESRPQLAEVKNKLANTQRKVLHLRKKGAELGKTVTDLKKNIGESSKMSWMLSREIETMKKENNAIRGQLATEKKAHHAQSIKAKEEHQINQVEIRRLRKQVKRADIARHKNLMRAKMEKPSSFKLTHCRAYSVVSRKLIRMMVASGCARSKVGNLLSSTAAAFGVDITKHVSRRTVSRIILEGYIASKSQIGFEISQAPAVTVSADGTSNRGINMESRHVVMRPPDYTSSGQKRLTVDPNSKPKMRLLCVDSTVDHTADTAVNGFINRLEEAMGFFNNSPHAHRLSKKVTVRDFMRILKGMHGDHASKEKSAARGMAERKHNAALEDLGEEKMLSMEVGELVAYLGAWNQKKIAEAGGLEEWNKLTTLEQSMIDKKLMTDIVMALGKHEYDKLSAQDRRQLNLFIWAGCCMHKDQNSFKAGNTEMMLEWDILKATPPILLANKANAATLRRILDPGVPVGNPSGTYSEDEQRAFEQTTRGGVKVTSLAGAIFNNKDDKKGQGDRHIKHFKEKVDAKYTHFPDTSNTRFGSHGDAAADLIQYLDHHISYLHLVRLSKQAATLTQIEYNVLQALGDLATQTELCAMVLYTQAVSKPYMNAVRGPETDNVLDLAPLHNLVREFVQKIIENPDLLVSEDISHVEGTLDGHGWDNPNAVNAVVKLMPSLPHLKGITVAFFRGALVTWERFSSEFAPGGLIDEASADEKHLAWMPATNDINEGALGAYRVVTRGKPSMTLHQYNALAMFQHNDTQSYMDAVFLYDDHIYIMREARRLDASGVEAKRQKEIVDFRINVARMRKEKEDAREQKLKAEAERLANVVLISDVADIYNPAMKLTVAKLGDQIDALRFRGLPDVPPKSRFPKKAERQAALEGMFIRYQEFILEHGDSISSNLEAQITVREDWEAEEEAEMDD